MKTERFLKSLTHTLLVVFALALIVAFVSPGLQAVYIYSLAVVLLVVGLALMVLLPWYGTRRLPS